MLCLAFSRNRVTGVEVVFVVFVGSGLRGLDFSWKKHAGPLWPKVRYAHGCDRHLRVCTLQKLHGLTGLDSLTRTLRRRPEEE